MGDRHGWRVVGTAASVSELLLCAEEESRVAVAHIDALPRNQTHRIVRVAYDGIEEAENGCSEDGYLPVVFGQCIEVLSNKPEHGHTRNRHNEYVYGRMVSEEGRGRVGWLPSHIFE